MEDVELTDYHRGRADRPIHPGEDLMADFIEELGITQNKLAVFIGVPLADQLDRARQAGHDREYRTAAGVVLRHIGGVLNLFAEPL